MRGGSPWNVSAWRISDIRGGSPWTNSLPHHGREQGPYEFEPAWRNSNEKKSMRIKNNIELQTDEKNIKVCTWLEHMFSNICFQNQISGTTNVLLIKRKCEHHYKGSDRYMVPPAGPAFGGDRYRNLYFLILYHYFAIYYLSLFHFRRPYITYQ